MQLPLQRAFLEAMLRATLRSRYGVEAVIVPAVLSDPELAHVYDVCETAGCECLYSVRSLELTGGRARLVWRGDEPFFDLGTPAFVPSQNIFDTYLLAHYALSWDNGDYGLWRRNAP